MGRPCANIGASFRLPSLPVAAFVERARDIDWNDAVDKTEAIKTFSRQLDSLQSWIARQLPEEIATPPLTAHVETLVQIRRQDLEPDPNGGASRIRAGVAEDRRVSIEDQDRYTARHDGPEFSYGAV
jgi:hypothetical protein